MRYVVHCGCYVVVIAIVWYTFNVIGESIQAGSYSGYSQSIFENRTACCLILKREARVNRAEGLMEAKTHLPTTEESAIVERVLRIVSSVRGVKPDYARLAAELEPAIPFDVFGVALLRHDHEAVRIIACERRAGSWFSAHHQHPLQGSRVELLLQQISSTPAEEPQPTLASKEVSLYGHVA